jgi:3-oxoacyl-[acyl-carrier protein] reductase
MADTADTERAETGTPGAGRVLITGASRGIGRATAIALAKRGCELLLMGRASSQHEQTLADCRRAGAKAASVICELTDPGAIDAAAREVLDRYGVPGVVINNAGVLQPAAKIQHLSLDTWEHSLAVNLRAPFLLCRALLPAMLAAGRGRLLHIASISGTIACPERAAYGASKWGLLGFHKALHEELKGTGLQSIALLPGSVDTDMLEQTPFSPDMSPEEVASLICYYALDAPDAVAGGNVEIYG